MNRIRLLSAGRAGALGVFIAIAAALVVYLVFRNRPAQPDQTRPKLQGKVVAVFSNTRYAHEVNGRVRFNITAGTDRTYQDGTHELEQVKLESYGSSDDRHDVVTCDRAKVSDPSDLSKLDAEFISNVVVKTSDGLTVKTNYLHYEQVTNTVDTKEVVEFEGRNYSGRATGIIVEANDERARLLKDVDVTIKPENEPQQEAKRGGSNAGSSARSRRNETPEERAARKARKRARKESRGGREDMQDRAFARASKPSKPEKKPVDAQARKELPTRIKSESALLEKREHRVTFDGNVAVTQADGELRADRMVSYTDATNHLERIEARGNAYLKQTDKAEIKSPEMDFFFGESHQLERAIAARGAFTRSLGPAPPREASADTIEARFAQSEGNNVETIKALGNARLKIHAPAVTDNKSNPAERELTAGTVDMEFFPDGKNIKFAEATGDAVMSVTPVRAERRADKKTIRAPHMTAEFYEQGNRVKTFNATDGVRVDIEALLPDDHPVRTSTSKSLIARFLADSQDVDNIDQEGSFKYNEGDRNALAERAVYEGPKEFLSLRGKRPMVWDTKGRTQADEIDYDRGHDETHARGDVRTTYYSRETTNDSTPFKNTKSPIFITAERADAQNKEGVAVYTIGARGWQDDNFVKADRIELYQNDKRMVAIGNVESALYQAKRETSPGKREVVPGFATADRMTYSDTERKIHYEVGVKARQGSDRIEAAAVDVYLQPETNEVDHLTADGSVVLTQPGRRGVGDRLVYTSEDGRAVLTGKTARVDDVEKGATMGSQLTFYSRDDRISVENQEGTGRVRSTHRLTKSKQN
ncbi:MAG TPA: LPS export ABC transporter periplasmic protein LptC [Blastocatellia bacterium]|nr:LPS export ABC transporter periplasmic protein LptC [Blastocatellia bacterium]